MKKFALSIAILGMALSGLAASWQSLRPNASSSQPASLTVHSENAGGMALQALFPGFALNARQHPLAGDYLVPEIPGCGPTETVGAPELPVLRRLVEVPAGATVRLSFTGAPRFYTLGGRQTQAFFPRQRPRLKGPQSPKLLPFDFDLDAYARDHFAPDLPCRLVEAGTLAGRRLVLVEAFPVAVNPVTQSLRVYPDLLVTLTFDPAPTALKGITPPLAPREAQLLSSVTLNAASTPRAPAALKAPAPRLLILAPDAWLAALDAYTTHRQGRGWTVDLFGTSAAGATPAAIQAFIRARYLDLATRPDALLLVGDVAQIPCFTGIQADKPDTDLYYACMDGGPDWQPEFPLGRLSVSSLSMLSDVLAKLITYDTSPPAPWMLRAAFLASKDNHAITEATHNAVVADWLAPRGYQSDKLYSLSRSATTAQAKAAFNEGRILGVYSGHGDTTSWADGPVLYRSDVNALTNRYRYPVVFSFACLTGQYSLNECFAEAWLRAPNKAAAGILASSVTSYWDEDDVFEQALFRALFHDGLRQYGAAIQKAKMALIETYGLTATVKRYFEQYNYFGDPATALREPALDIITASPLATAIAGEPYSLAFQGAGGSEPYAWSLITPPPAGLDMNEDGLLSGVLSTSATGATFTVRLADALSSEVTKSFRLDVAADALRITGGTNDGPFQTGSPFSSTLTASGGVAPYQWTITSAGLYSSVPAAVEWVPGGQPTGWQSDERSWKLNLPWPFPFYGRNYTSLWVNSNGYIDFGSKASQWDNSEEELAAHPRIAPLWDDLRTTNVFVLLTTSRAVIQWTGYTFNTGYPVKFEAILKKNGTILFAYRRVEGKLSPTIGVSAGDGTRLTLSSLNGSTTLARKTGEKIKWIPSLPAGVTLSPAGVLSGTAAAPLTRTLGVQVRDQSVPARTADGLLTLRVE
jgi:hypothetical protein